MKSIRWTTSTDKNGERFHSGEFGNFDTMMIDESPKRNKPFSVRYLDMTTFLDASRSFATLDEAKSFARMQARKNVLNFLQSAHDALEVLS